MFFSAEESPDQPVAQTKDYAPIPPGSYTADVYALKYKQNKAGTGAYVEATLLLHDEPYTGRRLWHYFNIQHQSTQAQSIGKAQFKSFLDCFGVAELATPDDMAKLEGKQVGVVVTTEDYKGKAQNRVKLFSPIAASTPVDLDTIPF
jgi:hypothetical protein